MKSARDRGEFGVWLRDQRTPLYKNVPLAVKALKADQGYGIAASVWAELEAGTRRPSAEQAERLQAFFDAAAPAAESGDLASAIRAQTEAMRELVAELREARQAQQGRDEGLAAVLRRLGDRLEQPQLAPSDRSQSSNG